MFESLSYKTKFYLVAGATILLLFIIFKYNVGKTVQMSKDYKTLNKKTEQLSGAQQKLNRQKGKLIELNKLLGSSISPSDLREAVLETVVQLSGNKGIDLWELPKAYSYNEGDMRVYTNTIVLTGPFKSLLQYLYLIETKKRISRIRSVKFIYTKKRGTRNERMYLEIYLQNIEIEQN